MALNTQALAKYLAANPKSLQNALSVTQFKGKKLKPNEILKFLQQNPGAANRMGKHLQRAVPNKDLGFGVDVTQNNSTQNPDRVFAAQPAASAPGSSGTTGATGSTASPSGATGDGSTASDLYTGGDINDIQGKGQQKGISNSLIAGGFESDANVKEQYGQKGQYGGSQLVTKDDKGNVLVEKKLGEGQQGIYDAGNQLSQGGLNTANTLLNSGNFSAGYNPELTARTTTGDINQDRARIEDEVFARYTKDLDQNYDRDRQRLEAELRSRGVPLTPESVQYQRSMEELDKRYDNQRADARQRAVEVGGNEFSRSFGIGEQLRGNELNEQSQIRTQQVGEIGAFAGIGPGMKEDSFNPYDPYKLDLPDPTEIQAVKQDIKQGADTVDINKQNADTSSKAADTAAKTAAEQIALERERNQILKDQQDTAANDESNMIAARSLQTGPAPAPSQAEAQAMDVAAPAKLPAPAPTPPGVPAWNVGKTTDKLNEQQARIENRIATGNEVDPAEAQRRLAVVKAEQERLAMEASQKAAPPAAAAPTPTPTPVEMFKPGVSQAPAAAAPAAVAPWVLGKDRKTLLEQQARIQQRIAEGKEVDPAEAQRRLKLVNQSLKGAR